MSVHDNPYALIREYDLALQVVLKSASKSVLAALLESMGETYGVERERRPHRHKAFEWVSPDDAMLCRRAMFVRNPFDRLVSCYSFFRMCNGRREEVAMPFDKWVRWVCESPERDDHYRPMVRDMRSPEFVGRFESLKRDWPRFQEWLGHDLPDLPHLNKTRHDAYREMYTSETRWLVEVAYREDLEQFGYEF